MSHIINSANLSRDNVDELAKEKEIILRDTYTDENWNILAEVIRTTTSLEKLEFNNVGYNWYNYNAIDALQNVSVADALTGNRTIKSLGLRGGPYGSNIVANAVAAILKENSTMQELDLHSNHIGVEGANAVADMLKENMTLQTIDLRYNHRIGAEEGKVIADALKENTSLQTIDLSNNQIGVEEGKAIADALKANTSLQRISLNFNSIGNEGVKAFADALKENTSLQELNIEHNDICEEGGKDILNALQQIESSAIETISLWGNQISNETTEKIDQEIARIKKRFRIFGTNERQAAVTTVTIIGDEELVIDQEHPFTKNEMGLILQQNINWLCCVWCDKWRMLRPDLSAEEVKTETSKDGWCCQDNIYDEDRQCCEAKQRDQAWMLNYWGVKCWRIVETATTEDAESQGDESSSSSSNNQDEGLPTIHGINVSQVDGSENDQDSNEIGHDLMAMEIEMRELQSTIAQQQVELAQKDKDIATALMEQSQTTRKMAELQSTIAQLHGDLAQKQEEIASLMEDLHLESEVLKKYAKCCVCLEPYEDLNSGGGKRLPIKSATCAHSLCEGCLDDYHASLMNGKSTRRYVRCPLCNDKTKKAFDIQNKVVDFFLREYIQCRKRKRST